MNDKDVQRISFAKIVEYHNSCEYPPDIQEETVHHDYEALSFEDEYTDPPRGVKKFNIDSPTKKDKTHLRYFNNESEGSFKNRRVWLKREEDFVKLFLDESPTVPKTNKLRSVDCTYFLTSNDDIIKEHFANPFSGIELFTFEFSFKRNGDKLTLHSYFRRKRRGYNRKYFITQTMTASLVFNTKTGNILCVNSVYKTSKKNRRSEFRTNSFSSLRMMIQHQLTDHFRGLRDLFKPLETVRLMHDELDVLQQYNDFDFNSPISSFLRELGGNPDIGGDFIKERDSKMYVIRIIVNRFISLRRIKVPDNYFNYIMEYYPNEKYLKKNKRKLIQSILDSYAINSKVTNKIIHEHPHIEIGEFSRICKLFGSEFPKYVGNLNDSCLRMFETFKQSHFISQPDNTRPVHYDDLNDKDRECMVRVLNSTKVFPEGMARPSNLMEDHIKMLRKIRTYYPNHEMTSYDIPTFNDEHRNMSKLVKIIEKGSTIEYQFDNRMIRNVESLLGNRFLPHILKTEENYIEEGETMNHCVATYSDKLQSIIISVRDTQTNRRVTCEYDKKTGIRIQARFFNNQDPPDDFNEYLNVLDKKIKSHSKSRTLDHVSVKRVAVVYNGVTIPIHEGRHEFPFL